jgi:type IV secretory pathway VirJ component
LAGFGAGGTLAYATLAQAPATTIAGAAAVNPEPALWTPVPLCEGAKVTDAGDGSFSYDPQAKLPGTWRSNLGSSRTRAERLVALVADPSSDGRPHAATEVSKTLPLVEYPVAGAPRVLAVIYSGDGGWRDIDKQIGEALAARGIPVVGLGSLRSFWNEKSPEDVARELAEIITQYNEAWHTDEVLLVGYSFGASILPFAINRLPDDVRATVKQVSLLGLGSMAAFKFSITEWIGVDSRDHKPVLPELVQLNPSLVQCFYGSDEQDTLCKDDAASPFEVIQMSGGHHFGGDYGTIVDRVVTGLVRRQAHVAAPEPTDR